MKNTKIVAAEMKPLTSPEGSKPVTTDLSPLPSPNPKSPIQNPKWEEPLLTKKTLADHYGLSIRTINYAMTLGLPKVPVGGRVRFRFSEVQRWFEKNGCRRFAAEGIKLAIQKSLAKQFHLTLSDQVHISVAKTTRQSEPNTKERPL